MTEPNLCEIFAEALVSNKGIDGSLADHAAACPACRDLQEAVSCLRSSGSAFPQPPAPSLTSRISKAIAAEPLPAGDPAPFFGMPGKLILGIVTIAVGTAILAIALGRQPSTTFPGKDAPLASSLPIASSPPSGASSVSELDFPGNSASATSAPTTSEDHDELR